MIRNDCKTIDEFIDLFKPETQAKLKTIRNIIHELAPSVTETISYSIPTFKLNKKVLVHFAAYETHIGFYPTPLVIEAFKEQLVKYKTSKGTVQFKHDRELPVELIRNMIQYRIDALTNQT